MKAITLIIGVLWFSLSSCGQDIATSKVPSVVQNAIKSKFANATNVEWEKKTNLYEAEFDIDSTEYTAHVDLAGKLILYKIDIRTNELPAAVAASISKDYSSYKIEDAEKIEKDGVVYYQVELDKKGEKDKQLFFSVDGKITGNIIL